MAWNDIFAFRVVLFTLCLSIDVDSQNRPPVSVAFFLLVQMSMFSLSRGLGVGPALLRGRRQGMMRHVHLLSMLQQFNIPYLSNPFVSTGIFLVVIIQIK